MKIRLDDIPAEGIGLCLDATSRDLESVLETLSLPGSDTTFRCELRLVRHEVGVAVTGSLTGDVTLDCSRCLEPAKVALSEDFRFFLQPSLEVEGEIRGEDVELSDEDLDHAFLEGGAIDVAVLVQEQLVLALPGQVLCRPDCQGICQSCGAGLNSEACRCETSSVDSRLEVLRGMRIDPDS